MELETYASVVEENYQRLADILLSSDSGTSKVQRLLSIDLIPAPPMKHGYAIWSEGLLAEAFACFPTPAFPALLEGLRTATDNQDTSRLYKALTMWGDQFAEVLSDWLYSDTTRLQDRAIHGLTLYAKCLNTWCDAETPSIETRLHQTNYPELVRFKRNSDLGIAPTARLSGHPRQALSQQLCQKLAAAINDAQRIAMLRCIGRLCPSYQPVPGLVDAITALASDTDSRTLEREAIIALCYLDRVHASKYIQQHWFHGESKRHMAAEILGLVRTDAAFEMLQDLMADSSAEIRRKAIASLESFESDDTLRVLNAHQDPDQKTQRQLLRSRNQVKRRLQHKSASARQRGQNAIYTISPLVLLSQAPGKPVFTEQELSAVIAPGLIADLSSSRRYAVELELFERQGDRYRLSGMGAAAHWVEGYLQAGLARYAGQKPDATLTG